MEQEIKKILKEKVDPVLAQHYGGTMLTGFEDGIARVKLTGSCAGCPSAQATIQDVVNEIVTAECDDVKRVELDTSVSDDLLDMARKILHHEVD